MKLKFIILFAFIVGYGGGLFVDIAAHGNESKILHVMETGEIDERWIPFQSTTGLTYGLELLKINSFERPIPHLLLSSMQNYQNLHRKL